jgi:hypothetical protein
MLERNTLSPQPGIAAASVPRRAAYPAHAGRGAPGAGFTQTLQTVQGARSVTVDAGDTLIGMIRDVAKAKGQTLKSAQEFQLAQQVAQANGIGNANRIFTGQKIDLSVLDPSLAALATAGAGRGLPATAVFTPITPTAPNATATAAAVATLRSLGRPLPAGLGDWFLERWHPAGGFCAAPDAPLPDLLSTAVTLHALDALNAPWRDRRETVLDFLDSLWTNVGAFHGSWADDEPDAEYTFYGLVALGHASV